MQGNLPAVWLAKQSKKRVFRGEISAQSGFLNRDFPLTTEIKYIRGENLVLSSLEAVVLNKNRRISRPRLAAAPGRSPLAAAAGRNKMKGFAARAAKPFCVIL